MASEVAKTYLSNPLRKKPGQRPHNRRVRASDLSSGEDCDPKWDIWGWSSLFMTQKIFFNATWGRMTWRPTKYGSEVLRDQK
ncbi:unnamed protein product [Calypogeia fissa]